MTLNRTAWTALGVFLMLTMVNMVPLWGQSGTSSALAGTVLDARGAAIPNAQVEAGEVSTGSTRTVRSNREGRFFVLATEPRNLPD
jgi:hypothetical protein